MTEAAPSPGKKPAKFVAPHPGSQHMPQWDAGELIDAPRFKWRNVLALIGPGLVMGAAAIGGGEWLAGPQVTARYGPTLLWVAAISMRPAGIPVCSCARRFALLRDLLLTTPSLPMARSNTPNRAATFSTVA